MPDGVECIVDETILLKRAREFDLLHGFTKPSILIENAFQGKVMVTIQGNGQLGEKFHRNTVFVSKNHAERHGSSEFVYNGLDADELLFSEKPRPNRYLFLSKTSWKVKNLKGAMRLANQHRQNLWIAGGDRPYSYRALTVLKQVFRADWRWVGAVNQEEKSRFLLEGKALLFPLLWNEPFGLVMTESLVSGTPVFAHPYGSVSEILEFAPQCLMRSDDDWKQALTGKIKMPSPKECRDWVYAKFDQKNMALKYMDYYERVAQGKYLNDQEPETKVTAEMIEKFS